MTRVPSILALVATMASFGCNARTPIFNDGVTSPTPFTGSASFPPASVSAIQILPAAIVSTRDGRGTVWLDFPAAGETTLTLSTSNAAVDITPRQLTIPTGGQSGSFTVTTRAVSADLVADVVASLNGTARSTPVTVWGMLPTFFTYTADVPTLVPVGTARVTPASARIEAYCNQSAVIGAVRGGTPASSWSFQFGAPLGRPLRPGVYENATVDLRGNNLMVRPLLQSCRSIGRFTVHEVELGLYGEVKKFWVSYEQSCQGTTGTLRGELRLTNVGSGDDSPATNCQLQ